MVDSLLERMNRKRQELLSSNASSESIASDTQAPPPKTITAADVMRNQMSAASIDTSVRFIDLDLIDVEEQVREDFDDAYILDLACEFALDPTHQPQNPVTLFERENGRYLLDTGENRTRAMRYAREHREEFGVTDPTAFTAIRATIRGPEPTQLKRTQSQVKENVLQKNLNMLELGKGLLQFFGDNPDASQAEAAAWCGFRNQESGRVKVNTALKLMRCDTDLLERVKQKDLSVQRALEIQDARTREQQMEKLSPEKEIPAPKAGTSKDDTGGAVATPPPEKGEGAKPKRSKLLEAAPKKQMTVTVPLERALQIGQLVNWIATQKGLEPLVLGATPGRKEAMAFINSSLIDEIVETINKVD